MSWLNLDHQTYALLKELPEIRRVGLAVSGGKDSAALWGLMHQVAPALGWQCELLHIHHGPGPIKEVSDFRNKALKTVQGWAEQSQMDLRVWRYEGDPLKTEAQFRQIRRSALFDFQKARDLDAILTAHHQQDLLETRLIHLIRGCGLEGLRSLKFRSEIFLRPFLKTPQQDLLKYVSQRQLNTSEDPTNADPAHGLRNWLRNEWLPALSSYRAGAVRTMAQSLEQVVEDTEIMHWDNSALGLLAPGVWDRTRWKKLGASERLQALIRGLQALPNVEFRRSQVLEVLKRLDNPQKEYKFSLRGLVWEVSSLQVKVTRLDR